MPNTVAIVGAAGYIGSYLRRDLESHGHDVTGYDTTAAAGCRAVRGGDIPAEELRSVDVVIYLAGLSGRRACDAVGWEAVLAENVGDVCALAAKLAPGQRLLYASSASVAEGCAEPADESLEPDVGALDSYARSMFERERALAATGCDCTGLRFGTVVGPSPNRRADLLLHAAMARDAVNTGTVRAVDPGARRGVLGVEDLARAVRALVAGRPGGQPAARIYHLASFNTTVGEAADLVAAAADADVERTEDARRAACGFALDTARFCADFAFEFRDTNESLAAAAVAVFEAASTPCRVCGHGVRVVVDLGRQPLANNYVPAPETQAAYPLVLTRCPACSHTQQDTTVPPGEMFSFYQYCSGTSQTMRDYFAWLAREATVGAPTGTVLELACNDGSQLDEFAKLGWATHGVDPAANLVPLARAKGHTVHCQFWGSAPPPAGLPTPDLIVAQNVLAHVPDPVAFLAACAAVMGPHTRLLVQTSQCDMYLNGEFDTIYHEHLSFFTAASLARAAELAGLRVTRAVKTPVHGTSFLFTMELPCSPWSHPPYWVVNHDASLRDMVAAERAAGLLCGSFFKAYKQRITHVRGWVRAQLRAARLAGYATVAFGAAAKGMTLLNAFDLGECVEYIVDDAEMKQCMYTPGTNIPILPPARLAQDSRPLAILVLAWNFVEEISRNAARQRAGRPTRLIVPFPRQEVIELF